MRVKPRVPVDWQDGWVRARHPAVNPFCTTFLFIRPFGQIGGENDESASAA